MYKEDNSRTKNTNDNCKYQVTINDQNEKS